MKLISATSDNIYVVPFGLGGDILFPDQLKYATMLFSDDTQVVQRVKGFITSGSLTPHGERSCLHMELKGRNVLLLPKGVLQTRALSVRYVKPPHGDLSSVIGQAVTSYSANGTRYDCIGPVTVNQYPNVTMRFPDYYGSGSRDIKNAWFVWRSEGNTVTFTWHYEEYIKSRKKWNTTNLSRSIIIDWPNRRYYTSRWNPMLKLDFTDASAERPAYSKFLLPRDRLSYERLVDRAERRFAQHDDNQVYGELVRRCGNDARTIPTNSIELTMELRNIVETLKSMLGLAKGKVNPKLLASAYLSYKYGVRLTTMDLKAVADGLSRALGRIDKDSSRSRAREAYSYTGNTEREGILDVVYNYKIIHKLHADPVRDVLRGWFDSGLFPSLTNTWDLIPFSFVLDWFFKVESYLDAIDSNTYWSTYHIEEVIFSKKELFRDTNWLISDANWDLAGDLSLVKYHRHIGHRVHSPSFFDPSPRIFKNYAELTSLIVANSR